MKGTVLMKYRRMITKSSTVVDPGLGLRADPRVMVCG